ncbi:MAG: SpoIIE family protein phosphatase [Vicinamibacterales bacterium]
MSSEPDERAKGPQRAADRLPLEGAERLALTDRALNVAAEGVTIADARLPDRPLIYANEGFERLTGYRVAEVLGRNCRFLQGPATSADAIAEIRAAVAEQRECVVELLNYRRDETTFWNRLSITPVRDAARVVTHYIGVQSNITERREAEQALRRTKEALEHDMRLAARIQHALLPPPETELRGVRLAHVFHPCAGLAGDTVGLVPLSHDQIAVYLLDVSGHGVGAALLSFTLAHVLSPSLESALLVQGLEAGPRIVSPARVAERLNREFPMDRTRQYFTMVYGVLDQSNGRFEYVMAGHPAPVLLPRHSAPRPLDGGGLPIGMIEHARFEQHATTLSVGDRLYLYTDGVTEALDATGQEFGFARLAEAISRERDRPLREGLERVAETVRNWSSGPLLDDVTLLAVERIAPDLHHSSS